MSSGTAVSTVESKWSKALEYGLFGWPALVGIACLFALSTFAGSFTGTNPFVKLVVSLWLVGLLGGFVLSLFIAVSLYFDAKKVSNADVQWDPSPIVYGIGGFVLSGLVASHYLYKRYTYTAASSAWDKWWYGVVACFALLVVALASSALRAPVTLGVLSTVFVSAGVLPIVIYKDAVHVRGTDGDWLPNPVNYFLAVFVSSVLVVVPTLVSGYYLYKRHRHVGTP